MPKGVAVRIRARAFKVILQQQLSHYSISLQVGRRGPFLLSSVPKDVPNTGTGLLPFDGVRRVE